jgi:hypothetical protein
LTENVKRRRKKAPRSDVALRNENRRFIAFLFRFSKNQTSRRRNGGQDDFNPG